MTDAGGAPDAGDAAGLLAARLRRELREELRGATLEVTAEGQEGEIAVVRVPAALLPDFMGSDVRRRVLEAAREAGFRYGALDLSASDPEG